MKPALSVLLLCAVWALPVAYAETPGEVAIGGVLREATMHGLHGPDRRLSYFRGKPLLKLTSSSIDQFIDSERVMENMLGASHLPMTVLVDRNGRVVRRMYGGMEWDSPEALTIIGAAFDMEPPD